MTDFEKIKEFFKTYANEFVCYKVIEKELWLKTGYFSDYVCKNVLYNPKIKDFFVLEYPSNSESKLARIDSLDSFVFNFYFLNYGDKIVIDDAGRTFDCGCEAFEGNGVLLEKRDVADKYISKNGICLSKEYPFNVYVKTSPKTFILDTIAFTKVLQTLNNAQPFPPYFLELDEARETVDVLTRAWIKKERLSDDENSRPLALFNNHKEYWENDFCYENDYPPFFNKHRFIGLFFNSDDKVLIRNFLNEKKDCAFAIDDFVLKDESYSLEGLQRGISKTFGFDFFFGEIAPSLTTVKNKIITDFYIVKDYDVDLSSFTKSEFFQFEWITKEELLSLVKTNRFCDCSMALIKYLYELKSGL